MGNTKIKTRSAKGLTLLEMTIAMALIAVVMAAILPQFRNIQNSWDLQETKAEMLQNGRVLTDHINRNLAQAVRVTAVSDSTETNGYIEFEDNNGNNMRYAIAANNFVEFGFVGDLSELGGPVSKLQFTCYELDDLDTPTTDISSIRFIKIETTLNNSAGLGQDQTFTASVHLRTKWSYSWSDPIGWWKLDETWGFIATDSSGNGKDGVLTDMAGNEWTTGTVDGALEFDGDKGHISGIGKCPTSDYTVAGWVKDTGPATGSGKWSAIYSAEQEIWFGVDRGASARLWIDDGGNGNGACTAAGAWTRNVWHHVAVTWDGSDAHLYIDGVDMPITVYGTPHNPNPKDGVIGTWSIKPKEEVWYGPIDDVRLYDQALASEEIANLAGNKYEVLP